MGRAIEILLVDDSEMDVELIQYAFKKTKLNNNMSIVSDGEQAIQFLRKEEPYQAAIRPDLILLDINMPKMNGHEVLKIIKNDEDLKVIPVAMMTSSKADEDVIRSYKLHANCYIKKPIDLKELIKLVEAIENFWFSIVLLPSTLDQSE